ncbi:Cell division cycle protein 48 like [Dendrobium catenatum]|uniref:Cell division cycle protein 48 like n=1 Tax=Dendrobium catenatum TaxID=906689 RepID=A0A2I0VSG1_9ASPA|nr:Cell division cycle protein 48 like [Dendrobium catenatum]
MENRGKASSSYPKSVKKDFNTTILDKKKSPNHLVVDEAINDYNSVVSMHPETMEKLHLFRILSPLKSYSFFMVSVCIETTKLSSLIASSIKKWLRDFFLSRIAELKPLDMKKKPSWFAI